MSDTDTIRLDHDDMPDDVVGKVNKLLKPQGLRLVDDGQPHDGFMLFTLTTTGDNP